jgi:endonuclease YncB( thermonuclease family)
MKWPIALVSMVLAAGASAGVQLSGYAHPIDGDSLRVGTQEVRLFGIDAPESSQLCRRHDRPWACGADAAEKLSALVGGKQVQCLSLGKDQYGRTLARCRAGGVDLNRTMVATGYAVAFRRYSTDYVSAEESAKAARRGLWSGTFEMPSEVRKDRRTDRSEHAGSPTVSDRPAVVSSLRSKPRPSGGCAIKGNQSRRGERIYHLPGMPYYSETVAEAIFCTEHEARAAGYRRSRADRR